MSDDQQSGRMYYGINVDEELALAEKMHVRADEVIVAPDGSLQFWYDREGGGVFPALVLAPAFWDVAYMASPQDNAALTVERWVENYFDDSANIHSADRRYGKTHYGVKVPPGVSWEEMMYVRADEVVVAATGALIFWCEREDGESVPALILAPECWWAFYEVTPDHNTILAIDHAEQVRKGWTDELSDVVA